MRRRSDSLQANLCQAQQRHLKTIAPLSHRPIVLTDTIDYRTIGFLHYRPNPSMWCVCLYKISYDRLPYDTRRIDQFGDGEPSLLVTDAQFIIIGLPLSR